MILRRRAGMHLHNRKLQCQCELRIMRKKISSQLLSITCPFSLWMLMVLLICGCGSSKKAFNPNKQYPKQQLQADYRIFRNILEDAHPSLYWYTTKDSLDYYFDDGYQRIKDSMTEPAFRTLLSYVISKINCGHTSIRYSKKYAKYMDTAKLPQFPLGVKFWDDTAAVFLNINRHDSILTRGTIINSINDLPINIIRDSLFRYMVMDGYGLNHKYQTLSSVGNFAGLYQAVFGNTDKFKIGYTDSSGQTKSTNISLFDIKSDTSFRRFVRRFHKTTRKERRREGLFATRNIQVDTVGSTAYMTVTTFSNGNKLKSFFRMSFKTLEEKHIKHLVIDTRMNGGGNVDLSAKLTRYIANHKFKLADSLYSTRRLSKYEKYIQNSVAAFFFMNVVTKKKSDGLYHFGHFERHYFKPKTNHHFDGKVYILIGGNSFSATTLFVHALKGQSNVKVIGEETGGGAYGNTAWFIPEAHLPFTHIRFRLPRFRMVMNKDIPKTGRGIFPDIEIKPSLNAIRKGYDVKLEYIRRLIAADKE